MNKPTASSAVEVLCGHACPKLTKADEGGGHLEITCGLRVGHRERGQPLHSYITERVKVQWTHE